MDVSVVVTCWNGIDLIRKNLPDLLSAAKNPANHIKEILVVDDGSTDGSPGLIRKEFPQVKIVVHKKNIGYSSVCNSGVGAANQELVCILNADVRPTNNFLEPALKHFIDPHVFSVSFNEGRYGPGKLAWNNGFMNIVPNNQLSDNAVESDWGSGGSAIFRKSIWEKLGGMDEIFSPYYFEDIDIGWRAIQENYINYWEPKAKIIHEHEQTINSDKFKLSNRKDDINIIKQRNHLLLTWKNIYSYDRFWEHLFKYLLPRLVTHPGYFKVLLAALIRKIIYHKK